jgi:hypothetical protein
MSMNAEDMKDFIISEIAQEAGSAADANKKFGDAVLEYLCENMNIVYAWSGTNPSSGAPDPAVAFTATVSGGGTLTPSPAFPAMLLQLADLIKGLTITAAAGFDVAPLEFNPAGVLTVAMAMEDNQDDAINHLCAQIIASLISSFPNPTPASGSHAAFNGATTAMVIT